MVLKANTLKSKTGKDKAAPPKKKTKRKKKQLFPSFFYDERFKKISGFFFLLVSGYLLLAFTSFLISWFTWGTDDILSNISFRRLLSDDQLEVSNWTGRLGAAISHQVIKEWVGVSAYFFVLLSFILGIKQLINVTLLPLGKTTRISVVGILWLSTTMGLIFKTDDKLSVLGGMFGYEASEWLSGFVGHVGTAFLLVFIFLSFLVFSKIIPVGKWKPGKKAKKAEKDIKLPSNSGNKPSEDKYNTVEFSVEDETDTDTVINKNKPANDLIVKPEKTEPEVKEEIPEDKKDEVELTIEEVKTEEKVKNNVGQRGTIDTKYDPTIDLPHYRFPTLNLLNEYGADTVKVDKEELENNKNRIVETLNHYQIKIDKIKATIGPTVTLYEIIPAPGVRISKIKNLEDDIALSLAAMGIRIIAPIPGKGTIGIEVPNQKPEIVSIKSVLGSEKFQKTSYELPIGLGKTISNESFIADLTKMPHILMAGATGQGKSVGLNAILTSLLYKKHPAELKFVLVDPKKVELTLFSKIERHFLAKLPDSEEAIITDTRMVVRTLNSLCIEMDHRYELLKDAQVRNIKEYNVKFTDRKLNPNEGHKFLPYIVLIVDEFADLIMTAGKEIENPLTRLAQLARATGIHLIIATQRPSVNIITGTIKANFPARIAFRVISKVDSRTILDGSGADQLIGRGDMLLATGSDITRLQCAFVDTPEIDKITDFIGSQRAYPDAFHLPEYADETSNGKEEFNPSERDELFEDAARIIVQHQQGSTSLLQRKLKLGYNRAGRIIDQLEAARIVGPFEGSKAREVLVANEMALEQLLKDLEGE